MKNNEMIPLPSMPKFAGLTANKAVEMSGALARLVELETAGPAIIAPGQTTNEDEKAALVNYLAGSFLEHGTELLGCFFACRSEYQPLLNALKPVVGRVFATLSQEAKANEKA